MTTRLGVRVDDHRCIGAGTCLVVAPSAFGWDRSRPPKAEVLDPASVDEERLREAALACPTQAIVLIEPLEPDAPTHAGG